MFWFHTAFVKDGRLVLTKPELDKACRDKKKVFSKDFQVEMYFMSEAEYEEEIKKGKFSLKDLKNAESGSSLPNVTLPPRRTHTKLPFQLIKTLSVSVSFGCLRAGRGERRVGFVVGKEGAG